MNLLSWIILAAVAAWFVAAIVHIIRRRGSCSCGKGKNSCCGDCTGCGRCGDHHLQNRNKLK